MIKKTDDFINKTRIKLYENYDYLEKQIKFLNGLMQIQHDKNNRNN